MWGEQQFQREVLTRLGRIEQAILKLSYGPAISIGLKFQRKREKMPLTIQMGVTDEKYFVIGTDAKGNAGAQLGPGQTISVVSADPTTVTLTPDPTALPDNEGTPSLASGSVTPVKVGGPVNATWTVTNTDGTVAETDTDTVTVTTVTPGVATSIGVLFEEPTSAGTVTGALAKKK